MLIDVTDRDYGRYKALLRACVAARSDRLDRTGPIDSDVLTQLLGEEQRTQDELEEFVATFVVALFHQLAKKKGESITGGH